MTSIQFDLTAPLGSSGPMLAVFSARRCVQRMLDVEAALARAQALHGVIPESAAAPIVAGCEAARIDFPALAAAAATAGNLAIPLVAQLTGVVAAIDADAARYVHWGATSQDVLDTGLLLQLREAFDLVEPELAALAGALAALAANHRDTPMAARTWMQQALPTTLGLKAAGWLDAVGRHQDRLRELRARLFALQFGGAAGTLASLGPAAPAVAASLAEELGLDLPDAPGHAQRDRVAEAATVLGMLVGSLGKMARDISLLTQTEVGEAAEPAAPGRGGSSAMPHKRNPVGCAVALSAAVRVPGLVAAMLAGMVQEHERALGGWQAEWDTLPQIVLLAAGSLRQMREAAEGLQVDPAAMRANLDITRGQLMAEAVTLALGAGIGRLTAHHLVGQACREASAQGRHLREVLAEKPEVTALLNAGQLERLFDPLGYTGQAAHFVERVLRTHYARQAGPTQE
jgi:3-carboxy-cis,cis-muconate cycloisomerase